MQRNERKSIEGTISIGFDFCYQVQSRVFKMFLNKISLRLKTDNQEHYIYATVKTKLSQNTFPTRRGELQSSPHSTTESVAMAMR